MNEGRTLLPRLACAAALSIAAPPALAQYGSAPAPAPPPSVPRGDAQSAAPASPADVLRAIACAIGRDARPGAALLATAPRSTEERNQAMALLRTAQRCARMPEPIATSALLARGAAAEALYETQFATPAAARAPALGAAPLPRPGGRADSFTATVAPMYALVDCAVPRQPDLVRALLATEPRTPGEGAALTALNPAFQGCVPTGTQLTIDPRVMRSFFAEALYRWSVVQRDGATVAWAAAPAPAATPAPQ